MSDRGTVPGDEPTSVYYEEPYEDWGEDGEESPRRPRRRLSTPVALALGAILVAGVGFIGGVKVQKHSDSGSGGGNAPAGSAAQPAGGRQAGGGFQRPGAQGQGAATPTLGRVTSKNGNTLYVKDSGGNTVKVKATSSSQITRAAATSIGRVQPGDTVIVQGSKNVNGTVTATQITATASDAASLGGRFGTSRGFPG